MLWRFLALIHSSQRYTYILNSVFSIQSTKVVTVFNVDGRFGHENVSCSREYIFLISLCSLVFLGEIFFRSSHWSSSVPPLLLVFDNFTSHKHTTRKTKKKHSQQFTELVAGNSSQPNDVCACVREWEIYHCKKNSVDKNTSRLYSNGK